jgi:multidrug efflux pump
MARNSIGIVLVTGMIISTAFTLLFVPSIYLLLSGKHQARREGPTGEPSSHARANSGPEGPAAPPAAVPA